MTAKNMGQIQLSCKQFLTGKLIAGGRDLKGYTVTARSAGLTAEMTQHIQKIATIGTAVDISRFSPTYGIFSYGDAAQCVLVQYELSPVPDPGRGRFIQARHVLLPLEQFEQIGCNFSPLVGLLPHIDVLSAEDFDLPPLILNIPDPPEAAQARLATWLDGDAHDLLFNALRATLKPQSRLALFGFPENQRLGFLEALLLLLPPRLRPHLSLVTQVLDTGACKARVQMEPGGQLRDHIQLHWSARQTAPPPDLIHAGEPYLQLLVRELQEHGAARAAEIPDVIDLPLGVELDSAGYELARASIRHEVPFWIADVKTGRRSPLEVTRFVAEHAGEASAGQLEILARYILDHLAEALDEPDALAEALGIVTVSEVGPTLKNTIEDNLRPLAGDHLAFVERLCEHWQAREPYRVNPECQVLASSALLAGLQLLAHADSLGAVQFLLTRKHLLPEPVRLRLVEFVEALSLQSSREVAQALLQLILSRSTTPDQINEWTSALGSNRSQDKPTPVVGEILQEHLPRCLKVLQYLAVDYEPRLAECGPGAFEELQGNTLLVRSLLARIFEWDDYRFHLLHVSSLANILRCADQADLPHLTVLLKHYKQLGGDRSLYSIIHEWANVAPESDAKTDKLLPALRQARPDFEDHLQVLLRFARLLRISLEKVTEVPARQAADPDLTLLDQEICTLLGRQPATSISRDELAELFERYLLRSQPPQDLHNLVIQQLSMAFRESSLSSTMKWYRIYRGLVLHFEEKQGQTFLEKTLEKVAQDCWQPCNEDVEQRLYELRSDHMGAEAAILEQVLLAKTDQVAHEAGIRYISKRVQIMSRALGLLATPNSATELAYDVLDARRSKQWEAAAIAAKHLARQLGGKLSLPFLHQGMAIGDQLRKLAGQFVSGESERSNGTYFTRQTSDLSLKAGCVFEIDATATMWENNSLGRGWLKPGELAKTLGVGPQHQLNRSLNYILQVLGADSPNKVSPIGFVRSIQEFAQAVASNDASR